MIVSLRSKGANRTGDDSWKFSVLHVQVSKRCRKTRVVGSHHRNVRVLLDQLPQAFHLRRKIALPDISYPCSLLCISQRHSIKIPATAMLDWPSPRKTHLSYMA